MQLQVHASYNFTYLNNHGVTNADIIGVYQLFHSFQKGRISIKPKSKDGNDTLGNKLSDSVQDWMYFIDNYNVWPI